MRKPLTIALSGTLVFVLVGADSQEQNYKPNWKRIEADNGAVVAIDLNSISRHAPDIAGRRTAEAVVCAVENNICDVRNQDRWVFYCTLNRIATGNGMSVSAYVPPRSLGRRVMDIACGN